jgi:RNA polymerase sigma factor (sigma-70 family)
MVTPVEKEDQLNQIINRNKDRFLFIAQQYASTNDVQDLYHEILFKVWKGLDGFKGRSDPSTWAYRIALNTASIYRRKNFRRDRALRAYEQDVQTEQMGGRGEEQILREFEQSLPDTERNLFGFHLTDMSGKEVAQIACISEPILRVKISRLRNQYKQRIRLHSDPSVYFMTYCFIAYRKDFA